MHTENQIVIHAPIDRIFALGASIADWPAILPHYRYVTVSHDDGRVKQAEMGALRGCFPVKWRTSQVLLPDENRILFFHTGGVTQGMYVEWILTEVDDQNTSGVKVVISHELSYAFPLLTNWFARHIVGELFVSEIAGRTLARVKEIAEGEFPERQ